MERDSQKFKTGITVLKITLVPLICTLIWMYNVPMNERKINDIVESALAYHAKTECMLQNITEKLLHNTSHPVLTTFNGHPKIFHHLYELLTDDSETNKLIWKDEMILCEKYSAEFVHIKWNKSMVLDFINTHYMWLLRGYSVLHTEQGLTVAKYLIIHHYGGVIIGTHMRCSKRWTDIYYDTPGYTSIALAHSDAFSGNSDFILARSCDNFFVSLLTSYFRYCKYPDSYSGGVLFKVLIYMAGPRYLSHRLKQRKTQEPGLFDYNSVITLKYNVWSQYFVRFGDQAMDSKPWQGWDGYILKFLVDHWDGIMSVFIIVLCVLIALLIFVDSCTCKVHIFGKVKLKIQLKRQTEELEIHCDCVLVNESSKDIGSVESGIKSLPLHTRSGGSANQVSYG